MIIRYWDVWGITTAINLITILYSYIGLRLVLYRVQGLRLGLRVRDCGEPCGKERRK